MSNRVENTKEDFISFLIRLFFGSDIIVTQLQPMLSSEIVEG